MTFKDPFQAKAFYDFKHYWNHKNFSSTGREFILRLNDFEYPKEKGIFLELILNFSSPEICSESAKC